MEGVGFQNVSKAWGHCWNSRWAVFIMTGFAPPLTGPETNSVLALSVSTQQA